MKRLLATTSAFLSILLIYICSASAQVGFNPEYLGNASAPSKTGFAIKTFQSYFYQNAISSHKVWVMVPQGKRVQGKNLKLIRARNPQWEIGIQKTKEYWITTLPRTLVDSLLYKNRIGSTVALDALKQALNEKKVKLTDIIDTANQLGVKHRIYPYLETLAT